MSIPTVDPTSARLLALRTPDELREIVLAQQAALDTLRADWAAEREQVKRVVWTLRLQVRYLQDTEPVPCTEQAQPVEEQWSQADLIRFINEHPEQVRSQR